jgi:hypothetical protein
MVYPSLSRAKLIDLKKCDGAITQSFSCSLSKTQCIAILSEDFSLKTNSFTVSPSNPPVPPSFDPLQMKEARVAIYSKASYLGALVNPVWDEHVIIALLLIHTKYLTTEELFDLLLKGFSSFLVFLVLFWIISFLSLL